MRIPFFTSTPAAESEMMGNKLLGHLDVSARKRLASKMLLVDLPAEEILYHANDKITDIYFPTTSVLCMLTIMEDGSSIEAATVGHEGASWISASLGSPTMPCQTMVAVPGQAYKISARYVEDEIRQNSKFHNLVSEYAHALLISSLRTGACNSLHTLSTRAARWMLLTLDRTTTQEFAIKHDFMSTLMGCSRASLTTTLGDLEKCGGIHTRRGRIELGDRACLEASTCECYQIIRRTFEELHERATLVSKS
jgi:CRP-like cAMP-binding protein